MTQICADRIPICVICVNLRLIHPKHEIAPLGNMALHVPRQFSGFVASIHRNQLVQDVDLFALNLLKLALQSEVGVSVCVHQHNWIHVAGRTGGACSPLAGSREG